VESGRIRDKDEEIREQQKLAGMLGATFLKAGGQLNTILEIMEAYTMNDRQEGISHADVMGLMCDIRTGLETTISHGCRMTAGLFNDFNSKRRKNALRQWDGKALQQQVDNKHRACLGKLSWEILTRLLKSPSRTIGSKVLPMGRIGSTTTTRANPLTRTSESPSNPVPLSRKHVLTLSLRARTKA
jgi:hypothetical protein